VSSYKLPSCGDVPLDWDVELLNYEPKTEEIGLYNSKGVGEANVQLGLSARFAVLDAVRAARVEAGLDPYVTASSLHSHTLRAVLRRTDSRPCDHKHHTKQSIHVASSSQLPVRPSVRELPQ
jgi:xanthine dehydrogenase molybdopterin-binding subunit B